MYKRQIIDYPIPKTKTEVRSFLGLIGYYQKYLKDFSTIAVPLSDLTKGKEKNHQFNGMRNVRRRLKS